MFNVGKTRIIELPASRRYYDMLRRFDAILECDRHTHRDGQTGGHNCYINIARQHCRTDA